MGLVDHGKTTLLDTIRGTSVAAREPGQITQWIGASHIPAEALQRFCGPLLDRFKFEIMVPGLLFIDTPGHETFSNLRRRGGSAADIAIVVVDVTKGVEPQTHESISILRSRKTPFVVAANKIDLVPGWKSRPEESFLESFTKQRPEVQTELDNRIYTLIGTLSRIGFQSDRFDRIKDFTTSVAIVPTSAKTREGMPELLAMLVGLTQSYMKQNLQTTEGAGKGTVIEVKEEPGLGTTVNAIIYDGSLNINDTIVLGGRDAPITTKIRAILLPKPLDEIRDPRDKFSSVQTISAAAGVKIAAPGLETALAGSSILVVPKGEQPEKYTSAIVDEVERVRIKTDRTGIVLKTDTLGSLEAIITVLQDSQVPIRYADIGDVSKREIAEASVVSIKDPLLGVVLAFNVKVLPDAEEEAKNSSVTIFKADIIYHLIEDYLRWFNKEKTAGVKAELDQLILPGKIRVLPGFVFRRSKPAIVGVEVLGGRIKPSYSLADSHGRVIGEIHSLQDKGKDIPEATKGMQVAISIEKATVGRQLSERDNLFVAVPEGHAKILSSKLKEHLTPEEQAILAELTEIFRKLNPIWGF